MYRTRLYHPSTIIIGEKIILGAAASHHLLTVLRKKINDIVFVFNGDGSEFEGIVIETNSRKPTIRQGGRFAGPKTTATAKQAVIQIKKQYHPQTESSLKIHLGQAIIRGERMDYAVQKAVEVGVFEITPLITDFCQLSLNHAEKRLAHWQAIAISATEQSGRVIVPSIHAPMHFHQWIQNNGDLKILCCPDYDKQALAFCSMRNASDAMRGPRSILLAIGPEGGFSESEMQQALRQHYQVLSLGPRILRTETATVVALSFIQQQWGNIFRSSHCVRTPVDDRS